MEVDPSWFDRAIICPYDEKGGFQCRAFCRGKSQYGCKIVHFALVAPSFNG
jgi:hypothetical protein